MTTAIPTLDGIQAERKRRNRAQAHGNLIDFVQLTTPGFLAGWVHRVVCAELERFIADAMAGRRPRLILTMPPRHGKSTIVSQRMPVWAMGRYPGARFICSTYGDQLSHFNSRKGREIARSRAALEVFPGLELSEGDGSGGRRSRDDINQVREWEVGGTVSAAGIESRGQYLATAVGGGTSGRGAHIFVGDDLLKDHKEAASQDRRDHVWDWLEAVAETRLEPGGGKLLTTTRWHEDDPVGRIKRRMKEGVGETFRILDFAAVALAADQYRAKGAALHPERWSLSELEAKRAAMSAYFWAALYQQDPVTAGGQVIDPLWLQAARYSAKPAKFDAIYQTWDTAASVGKNAARSVCLTLGVLGRDIYVLDVWRKCVLFPELQDMAVSLTRQWRPSVSVIEDKSSGQQLLQVLPGLVPELTATTFHPAHPDTDKWTRMAVESPVIRDGRYHVPEGEMGSAHELELVNFGAGGQYKDDGDAASQFLRYLRENPLGGSYADLLSQW